MQATIPCNMLYIFNSTRLMSVLPIDGCTYTYNMLYRVSKNNRSSLLFGWWNFNVASYLILFYWESYESQIYTEYRRLNTIFFVYLISLLHIWFCITSSICVRRYFCFTKRYIIFHINRKLCQQTSSSLLHYSQNFNFPLFFHLKKKYYMTTE
jgi:hypothetical protein